MSDEYKKNFIKVRDKLNSVSSSFCLAKWQQVTLHLQNGRTHSCHHPSTHSIPISELKENHTAIHNTKQKKEARKQMLNNQRPSECNYCWDIEDLANNQVSDRYIKSSDPTWTSPKDIDEISKLSWDENINPTYVEVSFSNTCNFKCSYCSPVHSTKWVQEIKQEGPYKIYNQRDVNSLGYLKESGQLPIEEDEKNPYVEAFWQWWPELVKTLKVFRITGGEPLLDQSTFKTIDYLIDNPVEGLDFSINTNACVNDKLIDSFIQKLHNLSSNKKLGKITIFTSIDGHGKQAEYGRFGLNYEQWYRNINKMLTKLPNVQISIMCTTNIFSATSMQSLLEDVFTLKSAHATKERTLPILIDFNILRYPGFLNISLLPNTFKEILNSSLEYMKERNYEKNSSLETGFCNFEIIKFKRVIDFLVNGPEVSSDYNADVSCVDFMLFIEQHDKRRSLDFKSTFPELLPFLAQCKLKERELNKKFHKI